MKKYSNAATVLQFILSSLKLTLLSSIHKFLLFRHWFPDDFFLQSRKASTSFSSRLEDASAVAAVSQSAGFGSNGGTFDMPSRYDPFAPDRAVGAAEGGWAISVGLAPPDKASKYDEPFEGGRGGGVGLGMPTGLGSAVRGDRASKYDDPPPAPEGADGATRVEVCRAGLGMLVGLVDPVGGVEAAAPRCTVSGFTGLAP